MRGIAARLAIGHFGRRGNGASRPTVPRVNRYSSKVARWPVISSQREIITSQ